MSELVQKALAKDRRAILEARARGSDAVPELVELSGNPDGEVREIALYGLDETADPRGSIVFARALLDDEPMVRGVAMRALHKRPDPAIYGTLLDICDKSREPVVRHNIALIAGRIGAPTARIEDLVSRYARETDPFAKEGLLVALARMGDVHSQLEFAKQLDASHGRTRGRFLEHVEYIHALWVLPALKPVLEDTTPVLRIGVDGLPGPEYLRACDIAVNLIAAISGRAFSFPVNRTTNYATANLTEVRQYIEGIAPSPGVP